MFQKTRFCFWRWSSVVLPFLLKKRTFISCRKLLNWKVIVPTCGLTLPVKIVSCDSNRFNRDEFIKEADRLYRLGDYSQLYSYCKYALQAKDKSSEHPEVCWRMARAAKLKADETADEKAKSDYVYESFEWAKLAIELGPDNWACNKWYGILLDLTARFEGNKKRIENSFLMKKYLKEAVRLNPNDATTLHALGVWCYEVAAMPWYMKKIASAIYATPPESSYTEALAYFVDAERKEPGFYCYNLLYMAKCYDRLNEPTKMKEFLEKAMAYNALSADDKAAKQEANQLYKSRFG